MKPKNVNSYEARTVRSRGIAKLFINKQEYCRWMWSFTSVKMSVKVIKAERMR